MQGSLEVADIFRSYGPAYRQAHELAVRHLRAMRAIETCRTAELGVRRAASDCIPCPMSLGGMWMSVTIVVV